jgi:hypothetical protein
MVWNSPTPNAQHINSAPLYKTLRGSHPFVHIQLLLCRNFVVIAFLLGFEMRRFGQGLLPSLASHIDGTGFK